MPSEFNGDMLYELPRSSANIKLRMAKLMVGMDNKYDGYPLYKTLSTDIRNNINLKF